MKRHTKFFIVVVLIVGFFPALFTLAQEVPTVDELMAIIADLRQQITQLQEEVDSLKSESKSTKIEIKFLRTLNRGVTGEEVEELQEFLKQFPDIYPEGLVTGYFGPLTEKAVQKFQMKNEIVSSGNPSTTGFGQVGPQTRNKLNDLVTNGAGASGKIPPGILTAPGLQDKFSTTTATSTESETTGPSTSTPSGTVPAIPAIPSTGSGGGGGGGAAPATPAVPATPAEPEPDTTAPIISNIQTTNITETSADITWTTDESASGELYYAAGTPIFVATTTRIIGAGSVTSHSVNLSNLTASNTYYYVAVSKDSGGNTATSSEQSFTTDEPIRQCNDGIDNDGDGLIDLSDIGCTSSIDDSEEDPPAPIPLLNWTMSEISSEGRDPNIIWDGTGFGLIWATVSDDATGEVYFAKLNASGEKTTPDILISQGQGVAGHPSISWDGNSYGVVWSDKRSDGIRGRIYFAKLDSSGQKIGTDKQISSTNNWNVWPKIIWSGSNYGVVWTGGSCFGSCSTRFVSLDADGNAASSEVTVNDHSSLGNVGRSSIIWNGSEYGVTWAWPVASQPSDVYFRAINSAGQKVGSELKITSVQSNEASPSISWDGNSYGVAWKESSLLKFAKVSSSWSLELPPVSLSGVNNASTFISLIWNGTEYGLMWRKNFTRIDSDGGSLDSVYELTGTVTESHMIFTGQDYASVFEMSSGGIWFAIGD